jgi:uncharacterized membrane protein
MELIVLVLIVGIIVLWVRTNELAGRIERTERDATVLGDRLAYVATRLEELATGFRVAGAPTPADTRPVLEPPTATLADQPTDQIAEPPAAPMPARPGIEAERRRQLDDEIAAAAAIAAKAAAIPQSQAPAATYWVRPGTATVRRKALAKSESHAPRPIELEPEGPSLVDQVLHKLGLTSPTEGEALSRSSIEAWLEGRMLAVVGGIALLLGAVFFLSLAFSRGWITEPMRVLIGLAAGTGLIVLGELAFTRLRGILGHVLVAVGLAIVALALLAATRLYGLVPVEWGLAGAFVAAVAAAAIAVRHDSQLVAGFGLISVLAAPPVLGASPTLVTLLFVAVTLVGTTGVALFRTWTWLPPLAFVLAAPQLASYVAGDAPIGEALIAVAGFWLVNTVAAGGEETRHATDRLRTTTVTLLLAAAAFTVWAGFTVLSGPDERWRGSFLAALALAHLALGLFFLVRHGDRHPFGLIVFATGVASLTMAVPVQFGGPPVPIAWAAEAVALAWIAVLRRHPYSAGVSLVLAVLALGHLVGIEYPAPDLAAGIARTWPFVGPEGMTYGFMMVALTVAAVVVPIRWVRAGMAVVGGMVTLYVLPFELSGTALVAGWAVLAVIATGFLVRIVAPRLAPRFVEDRTGLLGVPEPLAPGVALAVALLSRGIRPAIAAVAVLASTSAMAHLVTFEYPFAEIVDGAASVPPFIGLPGLAFVTIVAMLAAIGVLVAPRSVRLGLTALGGLVALYVFPFELSGPALAWAWAALAMAALVIQLRIVEPRLDDPRFEAGSVTAEATRIARPAVGVVGGLAFLAVLGHLVTQDFPAWKLGEAILSTFPYAGAEGLSLAAALVALAGMAWLVPVRALRLGAAGIASALLAYSVTFEIDRPHVMVAWAVLVVLSLVMVRRVTRIELLPAGALSRGFAPLAAFGDRVPYAAAAFAAVLLAVQGLWYAGVVPFVGHVLGDLAPADVPFLDVRSYALAILALTAVAAGVTWTGTIARLVGGVAGAIVVAWLLPFELRPGYAVAGWSALALGGAWLIRLVPANRLLVGLPGAALAVFGGVVTLAIVAPPDRLAVDAVTLVPGLPILTDATVALGSIAVALGLAGYLHRADSRVRWAFVAAGVTAVYLLSVGLVDVFQREVGSRSLEALQKEAQVGLSVLWSALGLLGFASGLRLHRPSIRLSGLALLGLATVKVFVVDLASLDVAYRVLSLVALGVLLLVSAFAYSRMQHPHPPASPTAA